MTFAFPFVRFLLIKSLKVMNVPGRVLVLAAVCLLSCKTTHQEKTGQGDSVSEQRPLARGETIPPNRCRLVGTIVAIDSGYRSSNPDEPCSRVPCRATVRVDSVLGYGQAFPTVLSQSEEIYVKFAFTLGPTRELFPDLSESYPGIRVGSTFTADVAGTAVPTMGKVYMSSAFEVYGYSVKQTGSK